MPEGVCGRRRSVKRLSRTVEGSTHGGPQNDAATRRAEIGRDGSERRPFTSVHVAFMRDAGFSVRRTVNH
jgi:hypothetical protein